VSALVEVRELVKTFPVRSGPFQRVVGHVTAVDGVSLDIAEGETLGLVGESGCGKTTLGRLLLRLIDPDSGNILFAGRDLATLRHRELRRMRREPVSALDVSIQSQILNLLKQLQAQLQLTVLFIAHDLSVVEHLSDRVGVMYLGKVVEIGPRDELFGNPQHPYTRALLSAIPVPDPSRPRRREILEGELPSPLNPPAACRFHTRCPIAVPGICDIEEPELLAAEGQPEHVAACHLRTGAHQHLDPAGAKL
jgi:oligopeptide/dipeptide ABC transporter ATP-binding protein